MNACPRALALILSVTWLLAVNSVVAQSLDGDSAVDTTGDDVVWWRDSLQHQLTLPTSVTNRAGFTVDVSTLSYPTADTMPVSIRWDSTTGPSTAQRQFVLQLRPEPGEHFPPTGPLQIDLPLTVPQGVTQMRWTRYVPTATFGQRYRVNFLEVGRLLQDFDDKIGPPIGSLRGTAYAATQQEWQTRVMWVRSDADKPDSGGEGRKRRTATDARLARWVSHVGDLTVRPREPDAIRRKARSGRFTMISTDLTTVPVETLPHDWRAYQPIDWVVLHAADWQRMRQSSSDPAVALRQWIGGGGTLIVRGAAETPDANSSGDDTSEVRLGSTTDVDRYDPYRSPRPLIFAAASEAASELATLKNRWMQEASEVESAVRSSKAAQATAGRPAFIQTPRGGMTIEEAGRRLEFSTYLLDFLDESTDRRGSSEAAAATSLETLGGGLVLTIRPTSEGASLEVMDWMLIDQLTGWRKSRLLRRGVDPVIGSSRFAEWLIPGVAQPPVYTFIGLLTLFVVLVGPVFYRRTMRSGRGYLIFAIAPALAAATTLAMVGYGVIADGFGAQARVRQITWIDGARGDAFTRTHSTLFTGIRPADGLKFPGDAEVLLYPDSDTRSWLQRVDDSSGLRGRVRVTEDRLQFSSDFLPSRQQKQFVMRRPRSGFGTIRLVDGGKGDPASPLRVASSMESTLRSVVLRAPDGAYWFASQIPAGETVTCTTLSSSGASLELGELYRRQWLISDGTARRNRRSPWSYRSDDTWDLVQSVAEQYADGQAPTQGIFEEELQRRTQMGAGLPAGTFVGETDLTADAVALEQADVTESIHYVMGDYQ